MKAWTVFCVALLVSSASARRLLQEDVSGSHGLMGAAVGQLALPKRRVGTRQSPLTSAPHPVIEGCSCLPGCGDASAVCLRTCAAMLGGPRPDQTRTSLLGSKLIVARRLKEPLIAPARPPPTQNPPLLAPRRRRRRPPAARTPMASPPSPSCLQCSDIGAVLAPFTELKSIATLVRGERQRRRRSMHAARTSGGVAAQRARRSRRMCSQRAATDTWLRSFTTSMPFLACLVPGDRLRPAARRRALGRHHLPAHQRGRRGAGGHCQRPAGGERGVAGSSAASELLWLVCSSWHEHERALAGGRPLGVPRRCARPPAHPPLFAFLPPRAPQLNATIDTLADTVGPLASVAAPKVRPGWEGGVGPRQWGRAWARHGVGVACLTLSQRTVLGPARAALAAAVGRTLRLEGVSLPAAEACAWLAARRGPHLSACLPRLPRLPADLSPYSRRRPPVPPPPLCRS